MKKIIPILVCACMLLSLLSGCGGAKIETYDDGTASTATDATAADTTAAGIGAGGTGYGTYAPDTVVATVDGSEVTWMEYFYWLNYYTTYVQQMAAQYGVTLSSWDAYELSSENTNAEVVLLNAEYAVQQYHVMANKAAELGMELTADELTELDDTFKTNADSAVGDGDGECTDEEAAAFETYLEEQYVDHDFYDYLNEVSMFNQDLFIETYGESGEKYSDEDTLAYAADNGLMSAKHILLLTIDNATGDALEDDVIAEKQALADDLLAQLQAVADDQEALIALFDELMADNTEDTGYATYPDGYIFAEGDMVEAFETAVAALDENYGLSDVVQSDYGFHIILRTPIDPDGIVGTDSYGNQVTLRYSAANTAYSGEMNAWMDAAVAQWTEGFDTLDMLAIFG